MLSVCISREPRPPVRRPDRRGRPPLANFASPQVVARYRTSARPARCAPGCGQVSLRALLGNARQQSAHLCFPIPSVTTKGPDRCELPGLGPSRDRFRVNPEHCGDLGRRKQRLGLRCTCRHFDGLSSWTGTAILRVWLFLAPLGSLPWMSHIVRSDHIAITSGDKSTTRSKVSDVSHPVAPQHSVTVRDSSDTERRNGRIRKSHPRLPSAT